jgi:S1-C subfamily serine protease
MAVEEITDRIVRNFNLPAPAGVIVSGVRRGGKAHEAGLERGAVILKMDGLDIRDMAHFKELYQAAERGKAHLLQSLTGPSYRYSLIPAGEQND